MQADAHFKYTGYGRENGSSATGGGLNAATIEKNENKLAGYLGVVEYCTVIDNHVWRGSKALLYLFERRDDVVFFSHINLER